MTFGSAVNAHEKKRLGYPKYRLVSCVCVFPMSLGSNYCKSLIS